MKTPDLHYYGPTHRRFPSREAWRNSGRFWTTPTSPDPFPKLRIDDEIEHPITVRRVNPSEIARLRKATP